MLQRIELSLLIVATLSAGAEGETPSISSEIAAEASRLEHVVPEGDREGPMKNDIEPALEALRKVETDLASGRNYRALERLVPSFDMLESAAFWYRNAPAAKDEALFLALWERLGPELEKEEELLRRASLEEVPAAMKARVEIAVNRILTHYRAARLYGKAGQLPGGLYYLGSARAAAELAKFCLRLRDQTGRAPRFGAIDEAERALSQLALAAYAEKDASTVHHRDFIVLDASLKEARELLSDGGLEGAVSALLDARLRLGLSRDSTSAPTNPDSVPYRERLLDPSTDHTMVRAYWERALDAQGSTDEAERRRAGVILEEVIPYYFELLQED